MLRRTTAPDLLDVVTTHGARPPRQRWLRRAAVLLVVLLLPLPLQHRSDSQLGLAWGMDNRLVLEGERLDPPGQWSWLTAGRPALVGEVGWQQALAMFDDEVRPVARDLRLGSAATRPVHVEPLAAAVGLAAAEQASHRADGSLVTVDAVLGGHGPPYSWLRSLAVGGSHGLVVGLVTYVAASGEDLAGGRHVAATGELHEDGTVGRVGGLSAKARGALRAGVDVLVVPAEQQHLLDGLDLGGMRVVGVTDLDDAIAQLRATR